MSELEPRQGNGCVWGAKGVRVTGDETTKAHYGFNAPSGQTITPSGRR